MPVRYTRHAILESMPDESITTVEVEEAIRKSSMTTRLPPPKKYKFSYKGLEVIAQKEKGYWLVITCYRT